MSLNIWVRFRRYFSGRPLAALTSDVRGVAVIEFGLVALPFLALLGATAQIAFTIWAQQNLDYAMQRTTRSLFTGQFQAANVGTTDSATLLSLLKQDMCGSGAASRVFQCSGVKIDVTIGTNFATSAPLQIIDPSTKNWSPDFGTHYTCAGPNTIVIATAAVKFPVFFSLLNGSLANFADGSKLLQSTVVFRTEPYGAGC